MKNPNGPSIEEVDDWNDAKRDAEEAFDSEGTPIIIKDLLFDTTETRSLVGVEVANKRIRAAYNRFEARHVKELLQHSVTQFELKRALEQNSKLRSEALDNAERIHLLIDMHFRRNPHE